MPSQSATPEPRIGVGVFILNAQNQLILGQRKGSHGAGTYALPGGHLEFGESLETCAARETLEETGMVLVESEIKFLTATNNVFASGDKTVHYVTVFMVARAEYGADPQLLEPEKCEGWDWVSWEEVRGLAERNEVRGSDERELFVPLLNLFQQRPGVHPAQALEEQV